VLHLEIEDAQLNASISAEIGSPSPERSALEIGKLLGFVSELPDPDDDHEDILLSKPPCITVHWKRTTANDTVNVTLLPLEFFLRHKTLSNLSRLKLLVEKNDSSNDKRKYSTNFDLPCREGRRREMALSCLCPSITLSFPFLRRVAASTLFRRSSEIVSKAEVTEGSICIMFENPSLEWMSNCDSDPEPGQSSLAGDFSFDHLLVFALSPDRNSIGFGVRMQRKDILLMSGRVEVNPFIPISVAFTQVVPSGRDRNPGRESFPIVPAISSFKARQEDDDDENDEHESDGIVLPKSNDTEAFLKNQLRANDPQISMLADAEKSSLVVTVRIPEIVADLTKAELVVFLTMLDAAMPPPNDKVQKPVTDHMEKRKAAASEALGIALLCENVTFAIREDSQYPCINQTVDDIFSFIFAADQVKLHLLFKEYKLSHFRILCHDLCIYSSIGPLKSTSRAPVANDVRGRAKLIKEGIRTCDNACTSLLFRSQMFTPISHETPSILLDLISSASDPAAEFPLEQKSCHLTLYHLTFRYDVDSEWICRLQNLLCGLKSTQDTGSQQSVVTNNTQDLDILEKSSMMRVFISCADINFDYTSPIYFESISRSVVCVGDLRFSSNIMSPIGQVQAYKVSVGDVNYHISNSRNPHPKEDLNLCRSLWLNSTEGIHQCNPKASVFGTMPEAILREMGFVNVLSLDTIDAVVSRRNDGKLDSRKSTEAPISIVLTLGILSIQACKDSFNCFTDSVAELQAKLTALTDDDIVTMKNDCCMEIFVEKSDAVVNSPKRASMEPFKVEQYLIPEIEVWPKNRDNKHCFLLDGYDWTTIDHDPLQEFEISPGEEQKAGWYNSDDNTKGKLPLKFVHQHFQIQAIADPLSQGDLGVNRFVGKGAKVHLKSKLVIQKMCIRIRFFDGYDWPDGCSDAQREAALRPGKMFVIEPEQPAALREKKKKLSNELDGSGDNVMLKRTQLMGELLDSDRKEPLTFVKSPLPEDRAAVQRREKHLQMNCRKSGVFFQVSLNGVTLRMDSFNESDTHTLQSIMEVAVANFFVAETVSLSKPIKMFGEWTNDEEHPRDTRFGNLMLSMATWAPLSKVTEDNQLGSNECEVTVQLLPMRLLLDQRAIAFIRAFVNSESDEDSLQAPSKIWSDGLHLVPPPRFKTFKIKPCKVKVDYRPARMDVTALREGSIVELVNITPIHRMVITLSEVTVIDSLGIGPVFSELVSSWVKEICATQLHKFLANARPFEPFTDVGQGLTDLVILPYEAFQAGESVQRAMRKGVKSLADIIMFQTLTTTSGLTKYAADLMADILGGGRVNNEEANPLPSRPVAVPKGIGDARRHACESLARGIQTANYKIVVVPYREFSRNGVTGAITSVIKGIPVLLVAPLTGATEAASYTLLGARNALRPDIRREEEASMNLH
jgi:autophagy-related protein 2